MATLHKDSTDDLAEAINDLDAVHTVNAAWICKSCASKAVDFFCSECVFNGNFTCSQTPNGPRFSDRRLELLQANQRRLQMANEAINVSQGVKKVEDLMRAIDRRKWIVKTLRASLEVIQVENQRIGATIAESQAEVEKENCRFEMLQQQYTLIKKKIIYDRSSLETMKRDVHLMEINIIKRRQAAVKQVIKDIFPLIELDEKLLPFKPSASCTTAEYCRILEPILPLNGNYSAYHNYASQISHEMPADINIRNPLYEVPAGLGMVAQLLHILLQILDFQMPDLVDFCLFLGSELDESSFQKAVYQLNWNILTLCSSQGIRVEDLTLKETVGNLLKLIKWRQLGRTGPYDLSNVLVFTEDENCTTTNSLQDAAEYEEHQPTELEVELDETWESIPTALSSVLPSSAFPSSNPQDQLSRSTFGTAVAGISSLFRSTMQSPVETRPEPRRPR